MIKINKYPKINGEQLRIELANAGVQLNPVTPYINAEKELVLIVNAGDESKVNEIVANHVAVTKPEPTIDDKLASVGLTINDLKTALGLS